MLCCYRRVLPCYTDPGFLLCLLLYYFRFPILFYLYITIGVAMMLSPVTRRGSFEMEASIGHRLRSPDASATMISGALERHHILFGTSLCITVLVGAPLILHLICHLPEARYPRLIYAQPPTSPFPAVCGTMPRRPRAGADSPA